MIWVLIFTFILTIQDSQAILFLEGLMEGLEQFGTCNIRVTADFWNIALEPILVPSVLIDIEKIHEFPYNEVFREATHKKTHLFAFKYRETICSADLVLHLGREPYDILLCSWYQRFEYMNDKYLVIVRYEAEFLNKPHPWVSPLHALADHRIFTWTIGQNDLSRLSFQNLYFMATICDDLGKYPQLNCAQFIAAPL